MDWLYRISIVCFAASYAVALGLEVSRVFFRARHRKMLILSISLAGFFAHTVYLVLQTGLELGWGGVWFEGWSGWCLTAAWGLMAAYLWVFFRKPQSVLGIFLLPVILALTLVGGWLDSAGTFSPAQARSIWNMLHAAALMLGTITVALGFVFGLAYLIHARRLKRRESGSRLFRLPSLEWLQGASEWALLTSAALLGMGLLSGLMINLAGPRSELPGRSGTVAWSDPVIWTSGILFLWLFAAALFSLVYRPARQGRKVAYLVVASFLFLVLELGLVWWWGHGSTAIGRPIPPAVEETRS